MSQESQTSIQKLNFMSICDMAEAKDNKIAIDKYHIDIMGDLAGAAFLTQLRYWFSPTTKSAIKGQARVGIKKEGKLWLAKKDEDWWDECYVTPKQVRRIKAKLVELKIVEIKLFKFDGAPVIHYHLDLQKYADLYHAQRVMNIEKDRCKQEKRGINKNSHRDSAQRAEWILPKGQNGFCPKGQIYNISSQHLLSAFNLKEHVENVLKIQNEKEMFPSLRGKALKDFKELSDEKRFGYKLLVSLPPAKEGDQPFNPVQALLLAGILSLEQIKNGLRVLEENIKNGHSIKNVGGYVSSIFAKGIKPKSENFHKNKDFWRNNKEKFEKIRFTSSMDCLEFDDLTAFYFEMDHEKFKDGLMKILM